MMGLLNIITNPVFENFNTDCHLLLEGESAIDSYLNICKTMKAPCEFKVVMILADSEDNPVAYYFDPGDNHQLPKLYFVEKCYSTTDQSYISPFRKTWDRYMT